MNPQDTKPAVPAVLQGLRERLQSEANWWGHRGHHELQNLLTEAITALTAPSPEPARATAPVSSDTCDYDKVGYVPSIHEALWGSPPGPGANTVGVTFGATAPEAVRERVASFELRDGTLVITGPFPDPRETPFSGYKIGPKGVARLRELLAQPAPASLGVREAATKIADSLVPGGAKWATDYDMRRLEQIIGRVAVREVETRIKTLEDALRPFAEAAETFSARINSAVVADHRTGFLTVFDFRQACRALAASGEERVEHFEDVGTD